tara:strand:+ start:19566 stop:21752 length:2187 start_codon:yes stop_codon:yes gene_type:complete
MSPCLLAQALLYVATSTNKGAKMGKNLGLLSVLLMFSSSLYAGNLSVKVTNQIVNAKVCNLPAGVKEVYFQVGQKGYAKNGIEQRENSFESGCAVKSYNNVSNDLFLKGGEVVASYTKDGKKVFMNADIPAKQPLEPSPIVVAPTPTPRPGTEPVVTPRPGTEPTPTPRPEPTPVLKTTPDDKVRTYGEQAANFMANRVVETYGQIENYRFNFYQGFRKQSNLYANLGIAVESLPEYHNGLRNGLSQGGNDGLQNGRNEGARVGSAMGQSQARARFQNSVGNAAGLNVTAGAQPTGDDFQGLGSPVAQPDFASQLSAYNNDFLNETRRGFNIDLADDILSDIYGNNWNLSDYYGWTDYRYDTLFSSWKAENAFTLLLNKKLVRENSDPGKIQANNQMVAKYREITDASQYSDADESRQQFKYEFVSQYNSVIGRKWNSEVYGRPNYAAQARGEYYFVQALRAYAQKLGHARGYGQSYTQASRQGYQQTLGAAYQDSFAQTVAYYTNNPVIENVRVQVQNQSGLTTVSVLDSIYPNVLEATNLGKAPGIVHVTLSGAGIAALPAGSTVGMDVPGLTRVTTAKLLNTPAQIAQNVKPNKAVTVNISIRAGGQTYSQSQQIMVSWSQTVKQAAVDANVSREAALAQYIAAQLAQEWKDNGLFDGNPYAKKPLETLAGQYVQLVQSLPAAEQAKLKKYNSALTAGYGKKPFLFSGKWKSVEGLFKQIGYKMP